MNALTIFKKRHLYDECEAEVNLCFDQFVYKLSEQIFRAFKQVAAGVNLDKKFRDDFNKIQASAAAMQPATSQANSSSNVTHHAHRIHTPNTSRYEILMKQRHLQLLGRSINLSKLLAQRIVIMIKNNLKTAISKFESSSLTSIIVS